MRKKAKEDPTYNSWRAMKSRCLNKGDKSFPSYGGAGISICPEWINSFELFLLDMGERPSGKTLDRIDSSQGYFKENCRWATYREQKINQLRTKYISFQDKMLTLRDWEQITGIPEHVLYMRLRRGWSVEDALTIAVGEAPVRNGFSQQQSKRLTLKGETLSLKQWSAKTGIPLSTLKQRVRLGWDDETALTKPIDQRKSKKSRLDNVSPHAFSH